jgi:hypothetical protein
MFRDRINSQKLLRREKSTRLRVMTKIVPLVTYTLKNSHTFSSSNAPLAQLVGVILASIGIMISTSSTPSKKLRENHLEFFMEIFSMATWEI